MVAGADGAGEDADEEDDAFVVVVPAVYEEEAEGVVLVSDGAMQKR